MKIVKNVMDSVPKGTKCAFLLPDKKLEKSGGKNLLKYHTLKTIIKMPENLFFGVGITTSIFIFETGKPQNGQNIIGYYVEDDGLETVKNKGRQDIRNKWQSKEDYWLKAIHDGNDYLYHTRQIIDPKNALSYQMPDQTVGLLEKDFTKTVLEYTLFERNIDSKEFIEKFLDSVLYDSKITEEEQKITIRIEKRHKNVETKYG